MKSKPLWATILLALAAAVIAYVTTMLSGCSVGIQGRVASWGATSTQRPPPVPDWATKETLPDGYEVIDEPKP